MRIICFFAVLAITLSCQTVAYGLEKTTTSTNLSVLASPIAAIQQGTATSNGLPAPTAPIAAVQQGMVPKELVEITARLHDIDSGIAKLTERADKTNYTPAYLSLVGSLFGVLVGGCITVVTQRRLLTHQQQLAGEAATHAKELADIKARQERELAEDKARLEIRNSFVQWRLKQLSELYGPLYALLRQSNVMYRHMNIVLQKADSKRFRLCEGSQGDDFDHMVFEINVNGHWVPFRTIMHIGEVYGQNYGIEDYFDELVAIGGRIVTVIAEKAGYIRPEQSDLVSVFGKYLAHYSVLGRLHSQIRDQYNASTQSGGNSENQECDRSTQVMTVDESAVFPKEILSLVDAGFEAISQELNSLGAKAGT